MPPSFLYPRGQSTGTREFDFRDFQGSKCRNLYSPASVPPRRLDPRGHVGVRISKSVLPRARGPQPPWTPCKFGKTFTSCHPHLRWSHSSPFRQHWSHTALVSGKSDDETACCSPIPQTFEALVRLPHNLFDVLAALLWQPHELVEVLEAFLWFQPSLRHGNAWHASVSFISLAPFVRPHKVTESVHLAEPAAEPLRPHWPCTAGLPQQVGHSELALHPTSPYFLIYFLVRQCRFLI